MLLLTFKKLPAYKKEFANILDSAVLFELAQVLCLFLELTGHRPHWFELMHSFWVKKKHYLLIIFAIFSKTEVHELRLVKSVNSQLQKNTKCVLIKRNQVDKKINSKIWW